MSSMVNWVWLAKLEFDFAVTRTNQAKPTFHEP